MDIMPSPYLHSPDKGYDLRCSAAADLLFVQFPPSLDELDDEIIYLLQSSPLTSAQILESIDKDIYKVTKGMINSRLYKMLHKNTVKSNMPPSHRSKAPIWSLK